MAPLLVRPALPLVPGWAVDALALPGLALLPPHIRDAYQVEWSPRRERGAELIARAIQGWTRVVPAGWRSMPQARSAFRRTRSHR
jgi:uncharacterized protein (DUF2236 family)